MKKVFCDICGKEITSIQAWSRYKLKREKRTFDDSWWVRLDVHDECWHQMCEYIKNKNNKECDLR